MNTLMENGVQLTLEQWMPEIFQEQIVGASEHLAKISQLPENEKGLKVTEKAYDEKNKGKFRNFCLKLNRETDKDIIDKLESVDSMQGYIKSLIRKDLEG